MDFAKKILGKYGWKEGDGLGKNNNGIAAPLKASLKFDNAGLGVDRATEFNDHWWERCFNEAASNVTVQVEQNGKVSTARKAGEDAVEISTKGYSARKLKKAKEDQKAAEGGAVYEHFLKSALLTQSGGEVANVERIKTEDIAVTAVQVLTDEQLFQACGGRTAHKGARHGLKLSGKLARLEQQEREMLAKLQGKQKSAEEAAPADPQPIRIKNKKRKKETSEVQSEEVVDQVEQEKESQLTKKSKKRKSEAASVDANATKQEASGEQTEEVPDQNGQEQETQPSKKSKKRMSEAVIVDTEVADEQAEEVPDQIEQEQETQPSKKSKKRKSETASVDTEAPVKSKKKKKKHKQDE